jgi:drug/metabolite transporter (DMT)-like permease
MYGLQNAIIDVKLRQYSTVGLLIGWYLTMLPMGLLLFAYQKYSQQEVVLPPYDALKIVGAVAIMFFIADFFYIGAFTNGGDALTITILALIVPLVVAITKFVWVGEAPTKYHLVAFACAVLTVVFVAIGNMKKPVEIDAEPAQVPQGAAATR